MADAVVIDDGGSTRIKQLKGAGTNGKLDGLLDQAKDFAKGPFARLRIACINELGESRPPNLNGAPAPAANFPIEMQEDHTYKLFSGSQRVECRIVNRSAEPAESAGTIADCQITVSGINGIDPVIEARQNNGQRRYIVSNAPSINRIDVNAAGAAVTYTVPDGTLYTVVILDEE